MSYTATCSYTYNLTLFYSYASFYPDGPESSESLSRIVSQKHAARIKGLLDATKGTIILGGQVDVEKRFVAPTIVNNVPADDSLMSESVSCHPLRTVSHLANTFAERFSDLYSYSYR